MEGERKWGKYSVLSKITGVCVCVSSRAYIILMTCSLGWHLYGLGYGGTVQL